MTQVRLIGCAAMEKGTMQRVELDGLAVCVARTDDGLYHAINDRCTHEDVELSGGYLIGNEIECPLHGSLFDIVTGEVCGLPADTDATVYPITVDGDDLVVQLAGDQLGQ